MIGLAIFKYTFDLSDEELCARWTESPCFQYLCGEQFFCHELPFPKLKAQLRMAAVRTIPELWYGLAEGIAQVTLQECRNYFAVAGYDQH